jgi:hypothetical protein
MSASQVRVLMRRGGELCRNFEATQREELRVFHRREDVMRVGSNS